MPNLIPVAIYDSIKIGLNTILSQLDMYVRGKKVSLNMNANFFLIKLYRI